MVLEDAAFTFSEIAGHDGVTLLLLGHVSGQTPPSKPKLERQEPHNHAEIYSPESIIELPNLACDDRSKSRPTLANSIIQAGCIFYLGCTDFLRASIITLQCFPQPRTLRYNTLKLDGQNLPSGFIAWTMMTTARCIIALNSILRMRTHYDSLN